MKGYLKNQRIKERRKPGISLVGAFALCIIIGSIFILLIDSEISGLDLRNNYTTLKENYSNLNESYTTLKTQYYFIDNYSNSYSPDSEQDIVNYCNSKNLTETSKCLVQNIDTFYKYNYTGERDNIPFEEIKANGGSCKDWSQLYVRLGNALGLYSEYETLRTSPANSHAVAIISDGTGYCVLDEQNLWCVEFTG